MTPPDFQRVSKLVLAALDRNAEQREAFLVSECGDDGALLNEVRSLLAAQNDDAPLDLTAGMVQLAGTQNDKESSQPPLPKRIGRYEIIDLIGEGGMGVVFRARQDDPKREVAVKLIRPGFVSPALAARFRHEAQVLGQLNHPGIAQVYEAGTSQPDPDTPGFGPQPFIAMEFVAGRPISEYARSEALSIPARLALLKGVCRGVEHAHLKGVIHRDLKPANILVTDAGQPKILDFGIARATDADIQMTTVPTDSGQLMGTLPYMSPEQVAGDSHAIDTRSDVYALGVIGYELLAGRLPIPIGGMPITAAILAIRDQEPPPLGSLNPSLRGDLQLIFQQALEKDPARRYQSVSDFANDLSCFLNNEPIAARPRSTFYEFRKLVVRHKLPFASLAALVAATMTFAVVTSIQARQILQERDHAQQQVRIAKAVIAFLTDDLLAQASPENEPDRDISLRTVLNRAAETIEERFTDDPQVEATVRTTLAETYLALGEFTTAAEHATRALELYKRTLGDTARSTIVAMDSLAEIFRENEQIEEASPLYAEALAMARKVLGSEDNVTLNLMNNLGLVYHHEGRFAEAEKLLKQVMDTKILQGGEENALNAMNNLAMVYEAMERFGAAETLHIRELELCKKINGPEHPDTLVSLSNLAVLYGSWGKPTKAEPLYRDVLEARRRVLGGDHPLTVLSMTNLAVAYTSVRKFAESEQLLNDALERTVRTSGSDHPRAVRVRGLLAGVYYATSRFDEAARVFENSLESLRRMHGEDDRRTAHVASNLAVVYFRLERFQDAETLALKSYEFETETYGDHTRGARVTARMLADLYKKWDKPEQAAVWQTRGKKPAP